jgi:hypothetical protein
VRDLPTMVLDFVAKFLVTKTVDFEVLQSEEAATWKWR